VLFCEHGVDQKRLVLVELSGFARRLTLNRDPQAKVVQGDALRCAPRSATPLDATASRWSQPSSVTKPMLMRLKLIRGRLVAVAAGAHFVQLNLVGRAADPEKR